MLDWLLASPSERRILGEARLRGPTAWVVAIMSFSIMLIAATGLVFRAPTSGRFYVRPSPDKPPFWSRNSLPMSL